MLSDRELVSIAWAIVAGQETTVSLIGTGLVLLIQWPVSWTAFPYLLLTVLAEDLRWRQLSTRGPQQLPVMW